MDPKGQPDDREILDQDRREAHSDWGAMATLVAVVCVGFVLLVALGYAARALMRSFG